MAPAGTDSSALSREPSQAINERPSEHNSRHSESPEGSASEGYELSSDDDGSKGDQEDEFDFESVSLDERPSKDYFAECRIVGPMDRYVEVLNGEDNQVKHPEVEEQGSCDGGDDGDEDGDEDGDGDEDEDEDGDEDGDKDGDEDDDDNASEDVDDPMLWQDGEDHCPSFLLERFQPDRVLRIKSADILKRPDRLRQGVEQIVFEPSFNVNCRHLKQLRQAPRRFRETVRAISFGNPSVKPNTAHRINIKDDGLKGFLKAYDGLEHIHLYRCASLKDPVADILRRCKKLKSLIFTVKEDADSDTRLGLSLEANNILHSILKEKDTLCADLRYLEFRNVRTNLAETGWLRALARSRMENNLEIVVNARDSGFTLFAHGDSVSVLDGLDRAKTFAMHRLLYQGELEDEDVIMPPTEKRSYLHDYRMGVGEYWSDDEEARGDESESDDMFYDSDDVLCELE